MITRFKLFEKLKVEPKRFLLEDDNEWFYIWEIMGYDPKEKLYWIIQRYFLTPQGKILKSDEYSDQPCDEKNLLTGIIKQSDNIQDLLDELQIKVDANKYNL
jgi:hypothetical protein